MQLINLNELFSKKVYIIILNYNGWRDTIECLESVLKNDYPNYQVIVVDNNSSDNSMQHIIEWAEGKQEVIYSDGSQLKHLSQPITIKPIEYVIYEKNEAISGGNPELEKTDLNPLILIQAGENRGFAAGNNIGIKYALAKDDFEYIWLLNNDTVIEKDSLIKLVKKAEEYKYGNKKIGVIGSKLLYYDNPRIIQGIGGTYNKWFATSKSIGVFEKDEGQYDNEKIIDKIDYVAGASMFVDKLYIYDVGLMCEDYFLYYEEPDWIIRGNHKGWKVGYCWQSKVYHKEGKSIGSNSRGKERSKLSDYYLLRNRIIFTKKFFSHYLWTVYLGFLATTMNRIRRLQFDRLKLVFFALFEKENEKPKNN